MFISVSLYSYCRGICQDGSRGQGADCRNQPEDNMGIRRWRVVRGGFLSLFLFFSIVLSWRWGSIYGGFFLVFVLLIPTSYLFPILMYSLSCILCIFYFVSFSCMLDRLYGVLYGVFDLGVCFLVFFGFWGFFVLVPTSHLSCIISFHC
ncbi:hypothetical protein QBC38DRAFT_286836 [Podospora fimiseda]|uniref:Uncharacterized protein n=1 Tax=Podospora fimiseda TaxID=252190 RepID=A0AAN7BK50_9PEZI|nr:hypothetical protein QBC38DRAFT_286836 [Podospora fimiseda]